MDNYMIIYIKQKCMYTFFLKSVHSLFFLGIDVDLDHYRKLEVLRRGVTTVFGLHWNSAKMAKYGEHEARPDDGQNEFSDIIKSRSGM